VQALSEGKDLPFEALNGVVKSCFAHCANAEKMLKIGRPLFFATATIPCIVINGRLFRSFLNQSSKVVTEEVPFGTVAWRGKNPTMWLPYVYVITLNHLNKLISEINNLWQILCKSAIENNAIIASVISKTEIDKKGQTF
jgi:hypothetical protein